MSLSEIEKEHTISKPFSSITRNQTLRTSLSTCEGFRKQEISDSPEAAVDLTSLARGLHPLANGYGRNPGLQAGVPTSAPP
jgi:hypothetical protein